MATVAAKRERTSEDPFDSDSPLKPLAAAWRKQIRIAQDYKQVQFDGAAREAMHFFNSDHSFLWNAQDPRSFLHGGAGGMVSPGFSFTYQVMAEYVGLFGPRMYAKNPNRQCNPRLPTDLDPNQFIDPELVDRLQELQQMGQEMQQKWAAQQPPPQQGQQPAPPPPLPPALQQQIDFLQQQVEAQTREYKRYLAKNAKRYAEDKSRAALIQKLLNYTPNVLDLKSHFRQTVDETLITGLSWLITELYQAPGSQYVLPGSFHVSSADVLLDPDASCRDECLWMARRSIRKTWQVERKFGKKRGSLKGNLESLAAMGLWGEDDWGYRLSRLQGQTSDLMCYWEIWSKQGMGGRLKNVRGDVADVLEDCGDYAYIVVSDGYDGVLNVPQKVGRSGNPEKICEYTEWPIPFWLDGDWPLSPMVYHDVPNQLYPMSAFHTVAGEIKFIDWVMSFLAKKVGTVCNDWLGISKSVADEVRAAMRDEHSVFGFNLFEIEAQHGERITDLVSYLQAPPFHGDIWKMVASVSEIIAKRLGLNDMAYGQTDHAFRSAAEAQGAQGNFSVRPDDMASKTEDVASLIARKEAIAARLHCTGEDVAPVLGEDAAMLWDKLVVGHDIDRVMREFDYRIEANSTRKPNRDRDLASMQQMAPSLVPALMAYAEKTGNWDPLNGWMQKFGEQLDVPFGDVPELKNPAPNGPDPKQQETQAKLALMQQQAELKERESQAQMAIRQQELQIRKETAMIEHERAEAALARDHAVNADEQLANATELQREQVAHQQELEHAAEKHTLDQRIAREQARAKQRQMTNSSGKE